MPASDNTNKYNTKLSDEDEKAFQAYLSSSGRSKDLSDYDMRGWFKESGKQAADGHFTDKYKKPNHPTFSNESQYNGKDGATGGTWGGDDSAPTFTPSKSNLKNMSADELKAYFSKVEPKAKLVLPENKADKRYGKKP